MIGSEDISERKLLMALCLLHEVSSPGYDNVDMELVLKEMSEKCEV